MRYLFDVGHVLLEMRELVLLLGWSHFHLVLIAFGVVPHDRIVGLELIQDRGYVSVMVFEGHRFQLLVELLVLLLLS